MTALWQGFPHLPALSLKQLQYFVTLAKVRHFTETANLLLISQPALSSSIRQIEHIVGGKLINRSANSVSLTALGSAILPHAQRILNVSHREFSNIHKIVTSGGGNLRIGLIPSVSSLIFPAIAKQLQQQFPHLNIEFYDQTNDILIDKIINNQLDFGIGTLDSSVPSELKIVELQKDPFVVITHRDDIFTNLASSHLTWESLSDRDIAIFSKGNIKRLVCASAESQHIKLNIKYQVDFTETLYGLVRSKLAVAILPKLYTINLHDPELKVLQLHKPKLTRTIALIYNNQQVNSIIESVFDQLLKILRL